MSSSERLLFIGMSGLDVSSLHNILKLLGFNIAEEEIKKNLFGDSTHNAIKQIQFENHLDQTGILDESTKTSLLESAKEKGFFSVKGIIVTRTGVAAKGLQVIAIDKNQGKDSLLGNTVTDDTGKYVILYKKENFVLNGKQNADIEIKIVDLEDKTKIYGISSVHFNADHDKRINIVLNDIDKVQDKRSEFSQIFNDLNKVVLNTPFRDLKENKDRQDISYLSSKTGWDARLVAMISLSDKYFHESQIESSLFYALFRAGISSNSDDLYKTNSEIVKKIWKEAIKNRIIDQSLESSIDTNVQLFNRKQKRYLLENMKPAGVSSLKDLLSISIHQDEEKQKQFLDLYFNHSGNIEEFWTKVENQFGSDLTKKLQLDSKLGYLTMNNAELIKKLESASFIINDPAHLIKKGLYKKEKWQDLFANNQIPIPQEIAGENEQEKKENYINYMTLLLKKSYPTLVVSEMIKTDELKVNDLNVKDEICDVLNKLYEKLEFQIGVQPIEKVIKDNPTIITIEDQALKELKKVQRIYQLTPSDETMKVLWTNNLNSALSIVQYDKNEFIHSFGESLGGPAIASTIYSKAHQIHSTVLNLATACMTYKVNPKIYALSQITTEEDSDDPPPIIDNPTLEELFGGSLEYCECDHCQSVLSPSSYLVDLLQFINLKKFNSDGNEILPHTYEKENPLDVLLSKRPDLEHIQLTCENTNTVLPYIDLVNEILEYFVVNRTIAGYEGFNIQDITTIELLANPQFVNEQAYIILKGEVYPFNLPFNRSLEYLRLLYNHLKIELNEAMEKLRVNENLDVSNTPDPEPYAWREIYNEFLGISPQEYNNILTNSLFKKLPAYFGEDENMPFNEFRNKLSNAKVFARKTDITYKELIELVSTKFINPDSYLIPKLQKLTVSFADIKGFIDGTISETEFNEKIPTDIKEQEQENPQYGGDILQWVRINHDKIMNLILLTFPDSEEDVNCRFDKLELRYSLPDSTSNHLKEIDFWCLFRFIRLWKKLGWTIEETDKVITALYSKELLPKIGTDNINTQKLKLDDGIKDLIIKVAHLKKIMKKINLKKSKLIDLLSLWSNIDIQGKNSLYKKMFLNSSISKINNVFNENGSGEYLQDTSQKIGRHLSILQAAFNLNIQDISLILEDAGFNNDSQLSLENVSNIYRYSFLAKCLRISIEELIMIKQMSGIDPFIELENVNPEILNFIDLVELIKKSKFKIDTLNYYLQHQDITGEASPSTDVLLYLAKTIKDGLIRIEQENTIDNDPNGEAVKTMMALVYENNVVDRFFGLLKSVTQYSENYDHSTEVLEQVIVDTSNNKLEYDDFAKHLIFHGVMTESLRRDLKNLLIVTSEFKDTIDKLYEKGQVDFADFFETFPELKELYNKYVSSSSQNENDRMKIILEDFMPTLKKKLKQLSIKQTLCSSLDVDLLMINELLENHIVLHSLQDQNENEPLIEDFLDIESSGTSVKYYFADEITSEAEPDIEESLSGNINFKNGDLPEIPNNPLGKISAIWEFFIETPVNENFNFYIDTDQDAKVEISIDEKRIEMVDEANSNGVWSNKEPILLQSGKLYKIKLQITNVKDKAILKWSGRGIGKAVIPVKYLYPYELIQNFKNSYIRLLKAIGIIQRLDIGEKEISFFSTNKEYQINEKGLLNSIPVNPDPPIDETIELFNKLIDLLKYVFLKEYLNIKDEVLTSIFENPIAIDENGEEIILKATRWDKSFLSSILGRFKWTQAEIELSKFLRINEAFEIVKKFGVNLDSLLAWTTNNPTHIDIHEIKNVLRSKYDESAWLNALQQISDQLRRTQRDALVSYILTDMQKDEITKKINTPDKLFEYFLIDVQMDPCMKTSRIKQAISTTQLFIQRCLMNLEPLIAASSINKNQWEWMQRYRVAEANEKIFLYPENFLIPELRDLKSPFFKELEGELLQADLNDELAEKAMLNYLEKLDKVSKLEICAMYLQENVEENKTENKFDYVLHVFGRTSTGASRKYYYRRQEQHYWTAWEQIDAEIEDDPILPVVWKNRLFLFWLNIVSRESKNAPLPGPNRAVSSLETDELNDAASVNKSYELHLCWSEYYNNKWQARQTSDFKDPIIIEGIILDDKPSHNLDRYDMEIVPKFNTDGSLAIDIGFRGPKIYTSSLEGDSGFNFEFSSEYGYFILNNTKTALKDDVPLKFFISYPIRLLSRGPNNNGQEDLIIRYQSPDSEERYDYPLNFANTFKTVSNNNYHPVTNIVKVPFFYQDKDHVFLVKPEGSLVTIRNYNNVFTDRGIFAHDMTIEKIEFPPIWEKPEIITSISRSMNDSLISSIMIDSRIKNSKQTGFSNKDNPVKKVILDNKSIFYNGIDIGPSGSKHARLLARKMIDTVSEFESVISEEETQ
jgi:hypothetical protein